MRILSWVKVGGDGSAKAPRGVADRKTISSKRSRKLVAQIVVHAQAARDLLGATLEEDLIARRVLHRRFPAIRVVLAHANAQSANADFCGDQIGQLPGSFAFPVHDKGLRITRCESKPRTVNKW